MTSIERLARRWWVSRRPTIFGEADHLMNPTINCSTEYEKDLALAVVAQLLAERRRERKRELSRRVG